MTDKTKTATKGHTYSDLPNLFPISQWYLDVTGEWYDDEAEAFCAAFQFIEENDLDHWPVVSRMVPVALVGQDNAVYEVKKVVPNEIKID
jgi:hypothetical protein